MAVNPLPITSDLLSEIVSGNRILLSRAITLIESTLASHQTQASDLIEAILPHTGRSLRLGITGPPGAGKSTFIEAFGKLLIGLGKKVAVLPVDPTSTISGGSILGDKTRMQELSLDPHAFIRPSPAGDSLGGVAKKTRETIFLCEAAGFDVIIVETVGVGQSETMVRQMVDFFLLLTIAGGGDDLQGIKRGVMEMADAVVINKADGDNLTKCKLAAKHYSQALHLFPALESGWMVPVKTCSALEKKGLNDLWKMVMEYRLLTEKNGYFELNRSQQNAAWFRESLKSWLESYFLQKLNDDTTLARVEKDVASGTLSVRSALAQIRKKMEGE